ncbi:MAG TPA: toll/interleukin-1 receptor domain-containing protein [Roseiarcus sp.]|nr:toll/interleukin-1 receptor domain-containing protein [Roseiarcus sp.]
MASGDAHDVSVGYTRGDEAAPAEPNVGVAGKGSAPSSAAPAARTAAVRYGAFISYSHAASAVVARGLQKWLQTYAKPWWRWRAVNVFRDETDLTAAPALWSRIADALDQSSHFILLASPKAAQSKWIKREVRYWLGDQNAGALDGADLDAPIANPKPERAATLLIALTSGDIGWDEKAGSTGDFDWSETNAVPAFSPDGKRIVTASGDGTARIWDVFPNTQSLVSAAKVAVPRCLTPSQRKAFFLSPEPPARCIEMEKWHYDTVVWNHWLADKRAGKHPRLPADAP